MRIRLICFGRLTPRSLQPAVDDYALRLSRWCKLELQELPEEKGHDPLRKEAESILKRMEGFPVKIALDSRGESWTSERWAQELGVWRNQSPNVVLAIGSADGLHPDVVRSCQKVSMGPVTLPHSLARLVLVEQIYRAHTQILGLPYHLGH